MSHTPGPWEVRYSTRGGYWFIDHKVAGEGLTLTKLDCSEDDALLIAAAPDLLAAIKEVMEDLHAAHVAGSYQIPPSSAAMAFDAIEKATGEKTCGSQMT